MNSVHYSAMHAPDWGCGMQLGHLTEGRRLVAGFCAGITEALIIVTPFEVVKIRLQQQRGMKKELMRYRVCPIFSNLFCEQAKQEGHAFWSVNMHLCAIQISLTKLHMAVRLLCGGRISQRPERGPQIQCADRSE